MGEKFGVEFWVNFVINLDMGFWGFVVDLVKNLARETKMSPLRACFFKWCEKGAE